jgi:two-component system, LuxR family, response regulator FixJ
MTQEPLVYVIDPDESQGSDVRSRLAEVNLEFVYFSDAEDFLTVLDVRQVGCVLAELKVGGLTSFQLVARLRKAGCSIPVVLLTSRATVPLVVQAFKAGVFDVLEKPGGAFPLWECVTRAFDFHRTAMDEIQHRNGIKNCISYLSRQELQVMQMLLDGEPNKRIASRLGLSQRTIVFRRKSVMQKMNARSVAELACLVHVVTSENARPSLTSLPSLLDVHVAASLCDAGSNGRPDNIK